MVLFHIRLAPSAAEGCGLIAHATACSSWLWIHSKIMHVAEHMFHS